MKQNNKKLLLVLFKFPPYSRVGSFRWTKFCRLFADMGYTLHVVSVDWDINDKQNWLSDVEHENIIIHRIPSAGFHNMVYKRYPANAIGKIRNKFRNQLVKLIRLFYYVDDAQYWGKKLIPFCTKLLQKENINRIITTGAPFMQNYWTARLKQIHGDRLTVIQDLRDEWNEGKHFISHHIKKKSLYFERFALNNCDAVVSVSPGLHKIFGKMITNDRVTQKIIYNGYERKLIDHVLNTEQPVKRLFSFIYAGSLDNGRDAILDIFLQRLQEKLDDFPGITIDIYTSTRSKVFSKHQNLQDAGILNIKPVVPREELYRKIYRSFGTLHFMPESQWFIVSIKLFEYAILHRPVISINAGGDTEKMIKDHNLGTSIDYKTSNDAIITTLKRYYDLWKKNPDYKIEPVDIDRYAYESIAREYLDFIENEL